MLMCGRPCGDEQDESFSTYLIRKSCKVFQPSVASCTRSHDIPVQIIFNVGTDERLKPIKDSSGWVGGEQSHCCSKSKRSIFPLTRPLSSPLFSGVYFSPFIHKPTYRSRLCRMPRGTKAAFSASSLRSALWNEKALGR